MVEYRRIDADTVEVVSPVDRISIRTLRQEMQALRNVADMIEPTREELIDFARQNHPYYVIRADARRRIIEIKELIDLLEAMTPSG